MTTPKNSADVRAVRLAELRAQRGVTASDKTATPRYRDYLRRYKGQGSPMSKDQWEAKVLGKKPEAPKGKDDKGEGKAEKPEAPKGKAEKPKSTLEEGGAKGTPHRLMQQWSDSTAGGKALSSVGKALESGGDVNPADATKALEMVNNWLKAKHFTKSERAEFQAMKKKLTGLSGGKAKGKAAPKEKPKSYKKTYPASATPIMDKHSMTDDDADQVKKWKKDKPFSGEKISDAEKLRRFLAKAKPETKERLKGMSPAEFVKLLAVLTDDEGEGGGKQAATRTASLQGKPFDFSW
jgi:hypothetical protein